MYPALALEAIFAIHKDKGEEGQQESAGEVLTFPAVAAPLFGVLEGNEIFLKNGYGYYLTALRAKGMGGGNEGNEGKGQSLAETHNKLLELLQENVNEEITVWNLPLGDKLWLPAAEALKTNTACKRLTIYGCDIGPEGATALADALMVNTGLESIDYNDNKMSWAGLRKIAAAWSKTRTEAERSTITTGGKWSASEVFRKPETVKKAAEVRIEWTPPCIATCRCTAYSARVLRALLACHHHLAHSFWLASCRLRWIPWQERPSTSGRRKNWLTSVGGNAKKRSFTSCRLTD